MELIDNRFLIENRVGSGSVARVFRALDQVRDKPVALKISRKPNGPGAASLIREHDLLRVVNHDNMPHVVAGGRLPDGRGYLVTEWIDAKDLRAFSATQPLDVHQILILARAIANALTALHAYGVIHRDIKPANILVPVDSTPVRFESVLLIDFGICGTLVEQLPSSQSQTAIGLWTGTGWYMAPEQLAGRVQTVRTDLFSLGTVMFELLFGNAPQADTPLTRASLMDGALSPYVGPFVVRRCSESITLPERPSIPVALREILYSLLQIDSAKRMSSAGELALRLLEVERELELSYPVFMARTRLEASSVAHRLDCKEMPDA
jgi:serine/threonine protein kinase